MASEKRILLWEDQSCWASPQSKSTMYLLLMSWLEHSSLLIGHIGIMSLGCSFSFPFEGTFSAVWLSVLITEVCVPVGGASQKVATGLCCFLFMLSSSSSCTEQSNNGTLPSLVSSLMNSMLVSNKLRCSVKASTHGVLVVTQVSWMLPKPVAWCCSFEGEQNFVVNFFLFC